MSGWLRRGAAAARLAGEHAELWPAGALASLAWLGWMPLLLVVAPFDGGDLQAMGVGLYTSSAFPANVIALSLAVVSGLLLLALLAVGAEAALVQMIGRRPPHPGMAERTLNGAAVVVLAALPAVVALAVVGLGIASHAASVFTSPDIDTPVLLRLARTLVPQLAAFGLAVLAGQVLGGLALHRILQGGEAGRPSTFRRLAAPGWGVVGVGTVGWLKDICLLAGSYLLLRVLWAPIGAELGPGLLGSPAGLLLLVGFIATWLALMLIGGALHAAVTAWWMLELGGAAAPRGLQGGRRT